jgi:hypothetical protein
MVAEESPGYFDSFLKTVGDLGRVYISEKYGEEDTPYTTNPQSGSVSPQGTHSPDTNVWSGFVTKTANVMTTPVVGNAIGIGLFILAGFLIYKAVK